jgi:hypothetical protein
VAAWENLQIALLKAAQGKSNRDDVRRFRDDRDARLRQLREGILTGSIPVGDHRFFWVRDPKMRRICAACFEERVLHHALMNVCGPILDRALIDDCFACRLGKGREAALMRARHFSRRYGWYLKLDIRKYFDSVDHGVLLAQLERRLKDPGILRILGRIIGSYSSGAPGRGLPIGHLTSQYFANGYLGPFDRWIREERGFSGYVRYMDDFAVWSDDPRVLREVWTKASDWLELNLKLRLKVGGQLNRSDLGMPFLGYRVLPTHFLLRPESRRRLFRRWQARVEEYEEGALDELQFQRRAESLLAFARFAATRGLRRRLLDVVG